jgi:acyl carrier protein
MTHIDSIISIIYDAIDDLNPTLRSQLDKTPETVLFGHQSGVDSVGLVRLVIAVEQGIEDQFGIVLTLADDAAVSQRNSPFRSVGRLAAFVKTKLDEVGANG